MDNGYHKIHTTNQKPSNKQIEVFHDYARRGLSNEIIALITGWRKPTIDRYVKENSHVTAAWNNVKSYANQQVAEATTHMNNEESSKLDAEIAALRKKAEELEQQKKAIHVDPFNWVVKYEQPKAVAKSSSVKAVKNRSNNKNWSLFDSVKPALIELFSDNAVHTKKEVDTILKMAGYSINHNSALKTLKCIFHERLSFSYGKYIVQ